MADKKAAAGGLNFVPFGSSGLSACVVDGALFIRIPVDAAAVAKARPSKTGTTRLVANSGGWTTAGIAGLPDGMKLNVMASIPPVGEGATVSMSTLIPGAGK